MKIKIIVQNAQKTLKIIGSFVNCAKKIPNVIIGSMG